MMFMKLLLDKEMMLKLPIKAFLKLWQYQIILYLFACTKAIIIKSNHKLPSRNKFMLNIAFAEIFDNREMLFNRCWDVFKGTYNVLFRTTNIGYLTQFFLIYIYMYIYMHIHIYTYYIHIMYILTYYMYIYNIYEAFKITFILQYG